MEFLDNNSIKLERELNELDKFVLDFVKVLQKHTNYVLISGYVALLFGRSRGTEDVDLFIEKLDRNKFEDLYQDLLNKGFWALNANSTEELFSMLNDKLAIRFAKKDDVIPNMEVKFVKDTLDQLTIKNRIKVITNDGELFISKIELQIAYKRFVLKSEKDLEDALYLQNIFNISEEKVNKYKLLLEENDRL
jgi:hypothetical protein